MATFKYDGGAKTISLGLNDHDSPDTSDGWNPVGSGKPVVAGVAFPVMPGGATVTHCVIHPGATTIVDTLSKAPIEIASQSVVLQCSGGLSSIADKHELVEIVHKGQKKKAAVLRMKNRSAFEQVQEWLPQLLALDFDEARQIAEAADREALLALETGYGRLLDVVMPEIGRDALAALCILCQGYLAVWASRLKTTEDRKVLSGKPVGDALGSMGWSKVEPTLLPTGLEAKLDDVSKSTWWRQCFGSKKAADLANAELKGKLNGTTYLKDLVVWIDSDKDGPVRSDTVAGAFNELCKELRCHA